MLLANFKSQTEKEAFINLAYLVAKVDGSLGYSKKTLIDLFVEEMGAGANYQLQRFPLNNFCRCFSTELSRQIAFANLITLAYVDGYANESASYILEVIQRELAIISDIANRYKNEMKIIQGRYLPDFLD